MNRPCLWNDLEQVTPGSHYFCLSTYRPHAHRCVIEARQRGAAVTGSIWDFDELGHQQWPYPREEQRERIDQHYGPLPSTLKIIAITGTNGKSSTAGLLQAALEQAGFPTTLIGTIGVRPSLTASPVKTHLTTPDYADLRGHIAAAVSRGDRFVVMEASSHALSQYRLGSLPIYLAAATAVTCDDHQEYHGSAYAYIKAKGVLFDHYAPQLAVLSCPHPLWFWLHKPVGRSYIPAPPPLGEPLTVQWQWPNLELCEKILRTLQIAVPSCRQSWVDKASVAGRFEAYLWPLDRIAWVDFAHTPNALRHLFTPWERGLKAPVWVIIGCGGERDRAKRPVMLNILLSYAKHIIITSDNPRDEPFSQIVADMLQNRSYHQVQVLEDRAQAIAYAAAQAPQGAHVFVLGKGHEETQVIGCTPFYHSDRQEVERYAHAPVLPS